MSIGAGVSVRNWYYISGLVHTIFFGFSCMSLLHDHLYTQNLRAFQLALDGSFGAPPSPSAGSKSTDVNARDWLGRTPLHIACASVECIDYVRALLKNPHIDVNLPDEESLWTSLHRALYSANISAVYVLICFLPPYHPMSS